MLLINITIIIHININCPLCKTFRKETLSPTATSKSYLTSSNPTKAPANSRSNTVNRMCSTACSPNNPLQSCPKLISITYSHYWTLRGSRRRRWLITFISISRWIGYWRRSIRGWLVVWRLRWEEIEGWEKERSILRSRGKIRWSQSRRESWAWFRHLFANDEWSMKGI